jgi:hypothetical protein
VFSAKWSALQSILCTRFTFKNQHFDNGSLINYLHVADNTHYHVSRYACSRTCATEQNKNHCQLHQWPQQLHSERWLRGLLGRCGFWVIGPYVFEDDVGIAVTVTLDRCTEMLRNFHSPELGRRGLELRSLWFQRDGATAHTVRNSMNLLW